ncbi:uncharacterized protein GGS22DRAFT_13850 [Annulohypoxylon maeteangense]|uniref:uncharacterized protein n=1 Tax=Annulohypoxylon maeteangense TaxID=1927788 RepID=UPI0020074F3E|nr:uncharacterized protein GGS22DRAFT_13850 [Annulohypoxylon maeteangense]KAI0890456.1 hypothetical protein GGS22DRAFT_13850 [Annulohypoxylon maeteangense]
MSVRPSSSRGLSSNSSANNSFKYDKRISRDDSFINSRTAVGAGFKSYNNFARGQLPTPEISPRTSPPRKISVPTVRMPTPESLNDTSSSEIGMALGSPTSVPVSGGSRAPQTTLRAPPIPTPSLVSPAASGISSTGSLPRKQSTKWKLFGRFGRKPSEQSLAGPVPNELRVLSKPEQTQDMTSQPWYDSNVQRSNTVGTRKPPKHKPIVIRSQTLPHDDSPPQVPRSTSRSSGKKTEETFGRIPIALDTNQCLSSPLLNVEIPDITMERYSVMFGSVLQSQPSLLTRRQATVQKLKSIEDAVEREEEEKYREKHHDMHHEVLKSPRRVTSPATGSPAFALFPPQRIAQTPPSNPSPLSRSNTSPAMLRSPLKAAFDHTAPNNHIQSHDAPRHNHLKESSGRPYPKGKLTIATLARAREQNNAPKEYQFSPDSSNLVLESPTEMSSPEFEVVKPGSIRPRASYIQEPKWQMITPQQQTPSTANSSLASDRKPPPSSPATSVTSKTSQDSKDEDDLLENSSNMNPVELSIARQISISRQQRKMLRPLQTATRTQRSPSKPIPVPKIAIGQNERLAETTTKTPILITPEETTSNSNLAAHRKSERVVLERA